MFSIEGKDVEVLSGGVLTDPYNDLLEPSRHLPQQVPTWVPAFGRRDVQWIVRGQGDFTVRYDGLKCAPRSLAGSLDQ